MSLVVINDSCKITCSKTKTFRVYNSKTLEIETVDEDFSRNVHSSFLIGDIANFLLRRGNRQVRCL